MTEPAMFLIIPGTRKLAPLVIAQLDQSWTEEQAIQRVKDHQLYPAFDLSPSPKAYAEIRFMLKSFIEWEPRRETACSPSELENFITQILPPRQISISSEELSFRLCLSQKLIRDLIAAGLLKQFGTAEKSASAPKISYQSAAQLLTARLI
jgi:hypothetical protein